MRPLKKYIDTDALLHNWQMLNAQSGTAEMIAVVKANAYGHDVAIVARTLAPYTQRFAVACIEEARDIRAMGLAHPIVLLEGIFMRDEITECAAQRFEPVIHQPHQLEWLRHTPHPLNGWLKIDSGMHRLGFAPTLESITAACQLNHVNWLGVISHFACADEADLTHARQQLATLDGLDFPSNWKRCYANSAAIYALPEAHYDYVRPGLMLYGLSPFEDKTAVELGLKPVMTLVTEILTIHALHIGDTAGYGCRFTADKAGKLAVIAIGYGDGFNRSIESGKVHVRIRGKRYPLVGRVAMDMCLVWLGEDDAEIGDEVIIFGADNFAEIVAREANTIPYTLTTMLTSRVPAHQMKKANSLNELASDC